MYHSSYSVFFLSSFFFFRQAGSNYMIPSQQFSHKPAAFYTEQCTSP